MLCAHKKAKVVPAWLVTSLTVAFFFQGEIVHRERNIRIESCKNGISPLWLPFSLYSEKCIRNKRIFYR